MKFASVHKIDKEDPNGVSDFYGWRFCCRYPDYFGCDDSNVQKTS